MVPVVLKGSSGLVVVLIGISGQVVVLIVVGEW